MKKETKKPSQKASNVKLKRLIKKTANLNQVFPVSIASLLVKSGHTEMESVVEMSAKSFDQILNKSSLDKTEIEFQKQRFKRLTQIVSSGKKPNLVNGLEIDLPASVSLTKTELKKLNNSGVFNLSDWNEYRDEIKISNDTANLLDKYSRLNSLQINGNLAKRFIGKNLDSAFTISRLSPDVIEKFSTQARISPKTIYQIVERAQEHSRENLNYLNLIDIYSPDRTRPVWIDDIIILNPELKCNPCAENESAFSCFAYYVYLVQKTGLTLDQLKNTLNLDFDLKSLSPLSQDEIIDDPDTPCNSISVLKFITRKLQDYLEKKRNGADSLEDRRQYDFMTYLAWRAERMAEVYPELKALWQNDILTSIDVEEEQGSILQDRTEKRHQLTEQINLAKAAIATAKVFRGHGTVSDQLFDNLDGFSEESFYQDYLHGFSILERILQADDIIQQASVDNQNFESGLALAKLGDALVLIDGISSEIFPDDSAWHHPEHASPFNYKDLIELSPARRKEILKTAFNDLLNGRKTIFEPAVRDLDLVGLRENGEIDLGHPAWSSGSRISERNYGIRIEPSSNTSTRVIHYDRGIDDNRFDNYFVGLDFRSNVRASVTIENLGIRIRTNTSPEEKFYSIKIIHAALPGDDVNDDFLDGGHFLSINKFTTTTGEQELAKAKIGAHARADVEGSGIHEDHTYRLSVTISGPIIKARLRVTSAKIVEVEFEDSDIDFGSFGIQFPSGFDGRISNFDFSIESGQGLPPFHNASRTGLPDGTPKMALASDVYYRHQTKGHGMSDKLQPLPFVRKSTENDKVQIHGVKQADKDLFMVFKAGTNKVQPHDINTTFERALAMLFYMRYAVIPIRMAQAYYQTGEFSRAIELLNLLYDDSASNDNDEEKQSIYPKFSAAPDLFDRTISPDVRLMKLRLAESYLSHAEALFRTDTDENKYLAQKYFQRVLDIHNANCDCESRIGTIIEEIVDRSISVIADPGEKPDHLYDPDLWALIGTIKDKGTSIDELKEIIDQSMPDDDVIDPPKHKKAIATITRKIKAILSKQQENIATDYVYDKVMQRGQEVMKRAELYRARQQARDDFLSNISPDRIRSGKIKSGSGWIYGTYSYPAFCVPQNPMKSQQVKQACLMLNLLENCLNILGFRDDFVPQLRFEALLGYARDFANRAQASERDLLNFRQLFEQESFSLMQAEQNLVLTDADVSLESLNVELAGSDRNIALFQSSQTSASRQHYQDLIAAGLNESEKMALMMAFASANLSTLGTVASAAQIPFAVASGNPGSILQSAGSTFNSAASTASSVSNLYSMQATNERREENWKFNLEQNLFSEIIAQQNVQQAQRRFSIAQARQEIAELKRGFALDSVQFLSNKFLNGAMYAWMIKTIREQYRTRLNYSIAASYMTERALAFEIQNTKLDVIRFDYFNPSRDGLLGATQLQTDLATLEQTHLRLSQRKLQLSKTLSLAQLFPVEFQRFKQTGQLPFSTASGSWTNPDSRSENDFSLELFDRDFPGHYMRLIKSIKVSVIALVPPISGIKASLRNSGISSAVIGPPYAQQYEEITIRRKPDAIALTAPFNATGVFVLDYEDKFLLPFEGNGVATDWIFELPKASNSFDFDTIFDVLVTVDYTSLESDNTLDETGKTYKQRSIERLSNDVSADRAYSLRHQYPDAWYHLNNPQSPLPQLDPMEIEIPVNPSDFPSNQSQLKVNRITLFARLEDGTVEEINVSLKFNPDGTNTTHDGGTTKTQQGLISKLNGNADNWDIFVNKSPYGSWKLKLRDENDAASFANVQQLLNNEVIKDILFVVSYTGKVADWI